MITSTHVCRRWRDTFISRASLWTKLRFKDVDKTRTYIQRSQSSPLNMHLGRSLKVVDDAFPLSIPQIPRLKSLIIIAANTLPGIIRHFRCHTPLLEKLDIEICLSNETALDGALFNRDFSSLRELRLWGLTTGFPWKNIANLRVADLNTPYHKYRTTQILDFLESAPLLHALSLSYSMSHSSDAPPGRIVPLRHLKTFAITANSPPSTLLPHLHIPIGTAMNSTFHFNDESPFQDYLPERSQIFDNLSCITTINLCFHQLWKSMRLSGPSGSLRVIVLRNYCSKFDTTDHETLRSLGHLTFSAVQRLVISGYDPLVPDEVGEASIFRALSFANNLRTLILMGCYEPFFIRPLDPENNPSHSVLCLNMEELVLYINPKDESLTDLIRMTKNRASRGAKLPSLKIISLHGRIPEEAVSWIEEAGEHVAHLEHGFSNDDPAWDQIPGESDGEKEP